MKYEFFTIGLDESYGIPELYGVAYSSAGEVCWVYEMKNDTMRIEEGLALVDFFDQLKVHIASTEDDMEFLLDNEEERIETASQLLYENEMKRNRG